MRALFSLVLLLGLIGSALVFLKGRTRRPLSLLLPLALALVVVAETVVLNVLSLFRGVTAPWVALANLGLVAAALAAAGVGRWRTTRQVLAAVPRAIRSWRVEWMLVPLALLVLALALLYPPSNYDSMTYRLARVAHWIQNGSIAYYPTFVDRQNWMPGGTERLFLVLQVVGGTDLWANLVQFLAWLACLTALPALARVAGVPRRLAPWIAVLAAALPMGILQACTTQTDLVASAMALGVGVAALPLLHAPRRWTLRATLLLILALCAAALVKPTALLAAAPFLLYLAWNKIRYLGQWWPRRRALLGWGAAAVALALAALGPDLARRHAYRHDPLFVNSSAHPRHWTFPVVGEWGARAVNMVDATYAEHTLGRSQAPALARAAVRKVGGTAPDRVVEHQVFNVHEDFVGNPIHMLLAFATGAWLLAAGWFLPRRLLALAAAPFLGWVAVHGFVRDQLFISRLQLPLMLLFAAAAGALVAPRLPLRRLRQAALVLVSLFALGYGYFCATHNGRKELTPGVLVSLDRGFYRYLFHDARPRDNAVLQFLADTGRRRLGLYVGETEYEYPLIWKAMRQGVRVEHYVTPSAWPEAIYSDRGAPPSADPARAWVAAGTNGLYVCEKTE